MAIINVELMHECSPENMRMGAARMKQDKQTDEKLKKSEYGKKYSRFEKKVPTARLYLRPFLWGSYTPEVWMNYLTNLTYLYKPSTTPHKAFDKFSHKHQ